MRAETQQNNFFIAKFRGQRENCWNNGLLYRIMCEMSGLAITGVHRLFDQLKILICLKSYHYKAIVGITHGIVQEMYKKSVAAACQENHGSVLIGDGAFDSRHQGEYCTYTIIAKASQKILSTVTVPRILTVSSAKLEEIGPKNAILELPEDVVDKIKIICTDESVTIVKKMKELNEERVQAGKDAIEHAHCVWHRHAGLLIVMPVPPSCAEPAQLAKARKGVLKESVAGTNSKSTHAANLKRFAANVIINSRRMGPL